MSTTFWRQIHGGSTHFPIVLLWASVVFDLAAWRSRDESLRRGLGAAAFGSDVVGMLGGVGAVIAGLVLTRGRVLGGGYERTHHLFVWPAVAASVGLVGWRLLRRGPMPPRSARAYLGGMSLAAVLMLGAGYSGGEMLLAADAGDDPAPATFGVPAVGGVSNLAASAVSAPASTGQQLYLRNCAHCHGADAHGDEGPDLHGLDWTDAQIAARIRNGKKGKMTAFGEKLSPHEISGVIAYLRTLNGSGAR